LIVEFINRPDPVEFAESAIEQATAVGRLPAQKLGAKIRREASGKRGHRALPL
jgi:hypothetical protein